MVYLSIELSPGSAGFTTKILANVNPVIVKLSDAAADFTELPEVVAVTAELVAVIRPGVAPAGICNVTLKVQRVSGDKEPPLKVNVEVPLTLEPVPQISFCVAVVEVNPVKTFSKSRVKLTAVASAVAFSL